MKNVMVCFALSIILLLQAAPVFAHDATLTYTNITVHETTVDVTFVTPYDNILKLFPEQNKNIDEIDLRFFVDHFKKGFTFSNSEKLCTPRFIAVQKKSDSKEIIYTFTVQCSKRIEKLSLRYNLFLNLAQTHENIADITLDDYTIQTIFSQKSPVYTIDAVTIRSQLGTYHRLWNGVNFLVLGIKHILSGYDHILFLLGLLLGITKWKQLLKVVTSFTIAHSITLIIATVGIFVLPARLTESIIALSILYVALEDYLHTQYAKRWIVTFFFGLIHGFGFSSVLRDIGLPKNGLIGSLISFNIGVEIGQLMIVVLVFPLLWFIRKKKWSSTVVRYSSIVIGAIGFFWFIERAILG